MQEVNEAAEYLIERLKELGFHVLRLDAVTTSSIYLKVDYGLCHSIRVGDHKGKKKYKYRYNVDISRKARGYSKNEGLIRHFFTGNKKDLDQLIRLVQENKQRIVQKYGERNYNKYMAMRVAENQGSKGFWTKAVEV